MFWMRVLVPRVCVCVDVVGSTAWCVLDGARECACACAVWRIESDGTGTHVFESVERVNDKSRRALGMNNKVSRRHDLLALLQPLQCSCRQSAVDFENRMYMRTLPADGAVVLRKEIVGISNTKTVNKNCNLFSMRTKDLFRTFIIETLHAPK